MDARLILIFFFSSGVVSWESCRFTDHGAEYMGGQNMTRNGVTCQSWANQYPHNHPYTSSEYFPDSTLEGASNYCRNPAGTGKTGPWCYTTDPNEEWEYCEIPKCDCRQTRGGQEYDGPMNVTKSGRGCQRWDSQEPHQHAWYTDDQFPEGNLTLAENHCRNPDTSWNEGPWCYTTDPDKRWEHCDVPYCDCIPEDGTFYYMGQKAETRDHVTCQRWDSQSPHGHSFNDVSMYPDESLTAAENYCRNPDDVDPDGTWCYTTDPGVEWDLCDVQYCYFVPPQLPNTTTAAATTTTPTPSMTSSAIITSSSVTPQGQTTPSPSTPVVPPTTSTSTPGSSSQGAISTTPSPSTPVVPPTTPTSTPGSSSPGVSSSSPGSLPLTSRSTTQTPESTTTSHHSSPGEKTADNVTSPSQSMTPRAGSDPGRSTKSELTTVCNDCEGAVSAGLTGLSTGAYIGIGIVGALVFGTIVAAFVIRYIRRTKSKEKDSQMDTMDNPLYFNNSTKEVTMSGAGAP